MTHGEHYGAWTHVFKAAGVPHVGTHGILHRAMTDIANFGIPTKVGMKLTGHKTVTMFMNYVHTEDKPVRDAAELVANRRLSHVAVGQDWQPLCVLAWAPQERQGEHHAGLEEGAAIRRQGACRSLVEGVVVGCFTGGAL